VPGRDGTTPPRRSRSGRSCSSGSPHSRKCGTPAAPRQGVGRGERGSVGTGAPCDPATRHGQRETSRPGTENQVGTPPEARIDSALPIPPSGQTRRTGRPGRTERDLGRKLDAPQLAPVCRSSLTPRSRCVTVVLLHVRYRAPSPLQTQGANARAGAQPPARTGQSGLLAGLLGRLRSTRQTTAYPPDGYKRPT